MSAKRVLLVGPNPSKNVLGGVIQHMRTLTLLPILDGARIFDPGSTAGRLNVTAVRVGSQCLRLRRIVSKQDVRQIWISTSIYFTAFMKLLLLLLSVGERKSGVRVFFHGGRFGEMSCTKLRIFNIFANSILTGVRSFHFLTRQQGDEFERLFPGLQWARFSNYLPFDTILPAKQVRTKNFLFVGRLVREKGIREIVAAIDELVRQRDVRNVSFWFAGDGPEMTYLERQRMRRPKGVIQVWGPLKTEALENLYSQAFLLLLPSYAEGFPYAVIEAMRAGLPVVATQTGLLPEIVKERENGFLVPPKDPISLARAIETLLDDRKLYSTIRGNNIRYFQRHLSKTAAEKYYNTLLYSTS